MDDLPELEAYLSTHSYGEVAQYFNISVTAAQSRIRRQTLTVMAVSNYLKHDPNWQEQYNYVMWRIEEHHTLLKQLLAQYKRSGMLPNALPFDERLLSSLTVGEFKQLMRDLLTVKSSL